MSNTSSLEKNRPRYGGIPAQSKTHDCRSCGTIFHPPIGQDQVQYCPACFMAALPRIQEAVCTATRGL